MKPVKNWRKATVSDIETDGLLEQLTKLHVVAFQMSNKDSPSTINGLDTERVKSMLLWHIENEIPIVGHNFILYDVPALEKLLGIDLSELIVIDTMALSWYLNPARKKHGLDGFGVDYGVEKPKIDNWEDLTYEEYQHRCIEDVKINKLLWDDLSERLVEIYSKSKEMIDAGLVGGKRTSPDEVIYLDSLVGLSVDEHIERLLTFLSFKMTTYKLQESFGIKLDIPYVEESVAKVEKIVQDCKDELESILPPIAKYTKKTKPKGDPYKKNGELTLSYQSWEKVKEDYREKVVDEKGNRVVLLGKSEPTVLVDGEERSRPIDDIEEFRILKSYEKANARSPNQIKDFLFAHGWVPENFKEVEDEKEKALWEAELAEWKKIKGRRPPKPQRPEPRKIPQTTIDGEDGKELCPSVEAMTEDYPEIRVYSNMNLWAHRLGVLKGFLKNCDENGRIKASAKGFTNTLRMCHAQVVNLVGVDKKGGDMIRGAFIADDGQIEVGSDLASLEDRTKHHFMLPYDPNYVSTMMEDDFDPHLLMAVTAGFITQGEMDEYKSGNKKPHVTKGRKLGKSCLPVDNTEVLTKSGWKTYSDINVGEEVLSLDEQRNQVWTKVKGKVFYPNEEVRVISNRSWRMEATNDHRWLVDKRVRTKSNPHIKTLYSETRDLVGDMNIITSGVYKGGSSLVTPDEAALVGWLLSDGYLSVSPLTCTTSQGREGQRQAVRFSVAQSPRKYLNEIKDLFVRLGLPFREDEVSTSYDTVSLSLSSPLARKFLNSVGLPIKNKHEIDYTNWVLSLSQEALDEFINAFWLGDGYTTERGRNLKSVVIYQNCGNVCEAIKLALHLTGRNVISCKKGVDSTKQYVIYAQNRPHVTGQRLQNNFSRYSDVFCLTTESGNFLVRQGGQITITGNCNYSAVYGAGAAKIAQTAKVDESVGRQLHEAYWNLNWSVQAIAADQALVKLEKKDKNYYHSLWLVNPVNGFCYSLRAEKDIFSTLCQGTGSFFFDMWVKNVLRRQKELFGVNKLQLQMHDELMYSFKNTEKLKTLMEGIIRDSIQDVNEEFLLRRKLDVDVQFGHRYSEIH